MSLSDAHNEAPTPYGIFQTNGIPITAADGIFAKTCRLNHSCSPNARYTWRSDLKRELVFAIRPICVGEEVTVSYKDCNRPSAERRAILEQMFKFVCSCPACSEASAESDTRRGYIGTLIDQIPIVGYEDQVAALELAEQALQLMAEEGIDTPTNTMGVHNLAFQLAMKIGDKYKAEESIRLCMECAIQCRGVGSAEAIAYEAQLGELRK